MPQNIVTHIGTVTSVTSDSVSASFLAGEACGNCQAKALCDSGRGRLITVETTKQKDKEFCVGQKVNVSLSAKTASQSVMLAYILPLIVFIVIMALVIIVTNNQDAGCLSALAAMPIYYYILYRCRNSIKQKIKFIITEI